MSDTLKTIAKFMGWELFLNDPDADDHYCTEEFNHESGALTVHYYRPHACRDDLQIVIEKIAKSPAMVRRFEDAIRLKWQAENDCWMDSFYALMLPTAILADIAAQVIKETP